MTWDAVASALALAGGLAAVATFTATRRDRVRELAAKTYVIITKYRCGTEDQNPITVVEIHNDSELPVYRLSLMAWDWGVPRITWRLRSIDHWMTSRRVDAHLLATIPPHSRSREHTLIGIDVWSSPGPAERPPVMLVFLDGHGRWWVRWPDGKLNRVSPSLWSILGGLEGRIYSWDYARRVRKRKQPLPEPIGYDERRSPGAKTDDT